METRLTGTTGGADNNVAVCVLYDRLASYLHPMYSPSQGQVGRKYPEMLSDLWVQCKAGKFNSEVPLMFLVCILRREQGIMQLDANWRRITNQRRDWKKGLVPELVQCVVATARRDTGGKKVTDDKSIAQTSNSMVA